MPFISSTAYTYTRGNPSVAPILKYPVNTLIAYDGNDPGLPGWTRYSQADGYYLTSTTSQSTIGTVSAATGGTSSVNATTGSGGSHTSTTIRQWISSTSGTGYVWNSSSGSHNHTYTISNSLQTPENMLNRQNITFLKATEETDTIPENALVFKDTAPPDSVAWGTTATSYLKGALNDRTFTAGVAQSRTLVYGSSSSGSHGHQGTTRGTPYPVITSGYFNNYDLQYIGAHTHSITAVLSQSTISSRLFKLWKYVLPSIPVTDVIVMYVGSLAALPKPWFLCNGLNGTINIGDAVIGYNTTNWNSFLSSNASGTVTVSSASATHAHNYTYRPNALNVTGPSAQHSSFSWTHSHTGSSGSTVAYSPPKIHVAFIQFKG